MNKQFLDAVFADSIQHPNFFNGRILTATDLRDEQTANLKRSRYLGQAIGAGVVHGLAVTAVSSRRSLRISAGLALNPRGDSLVLPGTTTVELVLTDPAGNPSSPFVPCDVAGATTLTGKVSTGYYLLAIANATRLSATMAPNSGLEGDRSGCTHRYEEIGVQFKLVPLRNDDFVSLPATTALDNRSRLAHACFGTNRLRAIAAQPDQQEAAYGLVDNLYQQERLTPCDVPLAVFLFQGARLRFVDQWAVRRLASPHQRIDSFLSHPFGYYAGPRRASEAAAFLLQFQAQLEDLRKDSAIAPAAVVAQHYFEYLPAAGYLPIQRISSDRRFRVPTFFGDRYTVVETPLEPERLRLLFHESFYQDPLRPDRDAVEIYTVMGTPDDEPYRLFLRRPVLPLVVEEEDDDSEDPRPSTTGDLYISVLSTTGQLIAPEFIEAVQAVHQKTGRRYTAKRLKKLPQKSLKQRRQQRILQVAQNKNRDKYGPYFQAKGQESRLDDFAIAPRDPGVYGFNDLPSGPYTVRAKPTLDSYYGVTKSITVKPRTDNFETVTIRQRTPKRPGDFTLEENLLTPGGVALEGFWVNPRWPDYYPQWEEDLFGPQDGAIDPSPEDWFGYTAPAVTIQIEELFARAGLDDPKTATADTTLYIRQDYDPAAASETVVAFVETADGSRFPAIPRAIDQVLDKSATVDRSEILDFDRATVEQLQGAGLAEIDAFASAPTKLVAGVLGQSLTASTGLVNETQEILQEDFRNGYMSYPGIGKAESDALKATFDSKASFANADPDTVAATLLALKVERGEIVGEQEQARIQAQLQKFAPRLLSDVKNTLPTATFTLSGTSITETGQTALRDIGITSNVGFREAASTATGRDRLKAALEVNDATLDRYLGEAAVSYALGEFTVTPDKSVAMLDSVSPDVATRLAESGLGSAKVLADQSGAELAVTLGISETEAGAIVNEAKGLFENTNRILIQAALQGSSNDDATDAIISTFKSPGDIAAADLSTLETTGNLDSATATKLKNFSLSFKNQSGRLRSGPSTLRNLSERRRLR